MRGRRICDVIPPVLMSYKKLLWTTTTKKRSELTFCPPVGMKPIRVSTCFVNLHIILICKLVSPISRSWLPTQTLFVRFGSGRTNRKALRFCTRPLRHVALGEVTRGHTTAGLHHWNHARLTTEARSALRVSLDITVTAETKDSDTIRPIRLEVGPAFSIAAIASECVLCGVKMTDKAKPLRLYKA